MAEGCRLKNLIMGRTSEYFWLEDVKANKRKSVYKGLAYISKPISEKQQQKENLRLYYGEYTKEEIKNVRMQHQEMIDLNEKIKLLPSPKKWEIKEPRIFIKDYGWKSSIKHSRACMFEKARDMKRHELLKEIIRLQEASSYWDVMRLSVYRLVGRVGRLHRV